MNARDPEALRRHASAGGRAAAAKLTPEQNAARTATARAAKRRKILDEIDPQRLLPADELEARYRAAVSARMSAAAKEGARIRAAYRDAAIAAGLA